MRELSIFIDESGDFGEYSKHSPYYIISMVLHDQEYDINNSLENLETKLSNIGFPHHCIHTAPIIRREEDYLYVDLETRQKLFKSITSFFRNIDVKCHSFYINKKDALNPVDATGKLAKVISRFLNDNLDFFLSYDVVKVYYDNGQVEVSKILSSVFNIVLENVEFRKVYPSEYRLFQVADLVCTLKLVELKLENHALSKSEMVFFESERTLKKNYLKVIKAKTL